MHAVISHPVRVHTTRMRGIQHQRFPTSLRRTSEKKIMLRNQRCGVPSHQRRCPGLGHSLRWRGKMTPRQKMHGPLLQPNNSLLPSMLGRSSGA